MQYRQSGYSIVQGIIWGILACLPLAAMGAQGLSGEDPNPTKADTAQTVPDELPEPAGRRNAKAPAQVEEDRTSKSQLTIAPRETRGVLVHVLDAIHDATIDAPGHRGDVVPDNSYFHRYWYSNAPDDLLRFHRRVILHDRSRIWRAMREALVLPARCTAQLPIDAASGERVLHFEPISLLLRGKALSLDAWVKCDEETLWMQQVTPIQLRKATKWPTTVSVTVPEACKRLEFGVAPVGKAPRRAVMVWGTPRIEVRIAKKKAPAFNVLYLVVDALRADSIAPYRTEFKTVSPAMDRLAQEGTAFRRSFANGNTTLLSMNTMLLGGHPRAMDFLTLWWARQDRRSIFYMKDPPYLTRLLHKAGFVTYGAVHNHLYFPTYKFSVDPGFDVLEDCGEDGSDHPKLTNAAIDFIRKNRERRWLVQLNLIAPHQPYDPPEECLEIARNAVKGSDAPHHPSYLGEVCWADRHVKQIMDALKEMELDDETIVVLTADHGEVMDRLHNCKSSRDGRHALHLHGITLYDEEVHIPIVFRAPGTIVKQLSETIAQHVDIVPTLLELLGLPISERMTGRSLKESLVKADNPLPDVPVYAERWLVRSIRKDGWKLIWHTRKDGVCPTVAKRTCRRGAWGELYHVAEDPREHNELSRKHPEKVEELRAVLEKLRRTFHKMAGADTPNP